MPLHFDIEECPYCNAELAALPICETEDRNDPLHGRVRTVFVKCDNCHNVTIRSSHTMPARRGPSETK
jgi:uncharacterized protein with PIN domain